MAFVWGAVRQALPRCHLPKCNPMMIIRRSTSHDYSRRMCGIREYVGYGWNGSPCYQDRVDYPFPAIRFREETVEICRLRQKEQCDWGDLTKGEIKKLYRHSFCQTFAEFKAPTAEWKLALGWGFWCVAFGFFYYYIFFEALFPDYPITFSEERKSAQLKRALALEMNPIDGLASWWDYSKGTWKK